MVFSSVLFLLYFLPIALILYFILPKRARNLALFVVSLVFYAWGEPLYISIMLFSTFFDSFSLIFDIFFNQIASNMSALFKKPLGTSQQQGVKK